MTDTPRKPKEPLLALLLSFIMGGLGQMYAGRMRRGVLIIILPIMIGMPIIFFTFHPETKTYAWLAIPCLLALVGFAIWIHLDAYLCAKRFNQCHNLQRSISTVKRMGYIAGILVLFSLPGPHEFLRDFIRDNYVRGFKVSSGGMQFALQEGDRIFTDNRSPISRRLKRGDIIVFNYPKNPERHFIQRVIAFGGETVGDFGRGCLH